MKKKICFVATTPGTIKAFILKFAYFLYHTGEYEISFICDDNETFKSNLPQYFSYYPIKMKRGIDLNFGSIIKKMTAVFKKEKYDIVQYSTPNASFYASIAAKKANISVRLYTQWGIRYTGFKRGLKRALFKKIEKIICEKSNYIECESFSLYRFALTERLFNDSKACVVESGSACGVDLSKFSIAQKGIWRNKLRNIYGIKDDSIVFGYVGRITKDKGINELLLSFKRINAQYQHTHLLIVGYYDSKETLRQDLLEWAEKNPSVIFVEHTDFPEQYYSMMDVFVSLSYREGFGLVVIEAASMGVPSIVSDSLGQIDTVSNGVDGFVVKAKDVDGVFAKMAWFISNSEKIPLFGENAYKKVITCYEEEKLFTCLEKKRKEYYAKECKQKTRN